MSTDLSSLLKDVNARYERLAKDTHYETLGVPSDAKEEDIRRQFRELAKRFHADRYTDVQLPTATKIRMQKLMSHISSAHQVLTSKEKRQDYDAKLEMEAAGVPTDIQTIVNAEQAFRKGAQLVERGSFAAALRSLESACKLNPSEPEFEVTRQYARYWTLERGADERVLDRMAVKEVVDALSGFMRDHRKNDAVLVYLGLIAKAEGDAARARNYFTEAAGANPKNMLANRELRLQAMRTSRQSKSGLFSRILTKIKNK